MLYVMSALYFFAGLNHFWKPETYIKIMPPYLPQPKLLVAVSGAAESFLGLLLLWPPSQTLAAWGIIALLIAIFPANLYMMTERKTKFRDLPGWLLIVRLPLQLILIYWAYIYT